MNGYYIFDSWMLGTTIISIIVAIVGTIIFPDMWPAWMMMGFSAVGKYFDGRRAVRRAFPNQPSP